MNPTEPSTHYDAADYDVLYLITHNHDVVMHTQVSADSRKAAIKAARKLLGNKAYIISVVAHDPDLNDE